MCLQLIARGILLPEDPSSDSVSASDLDFSNLSLYGEAACMAASKQLKQQQQ